MTASQLRPVSPPHLQRYALINSAFVVAMMVCAAASIAPLGARLSPDWNWDFLPIVALPLVLDAMVSKRLAERRPLFSPEWLILRGAEWIVILLGLRVVLYMLRGPEQFLRDLPLWQEDFLNFFSGEYFSVVLLALIIWLTSGQFAEDLADLVDEPVASDVRPGGVYEDRQAVCRRLTVRVFGIGVGLVLVTAVTQAAQPAAGLPIASTLLYFVLGYILISRGQLAAWLIQWRWERVPVTPHLAARWTLYAALLVLGLFLLAGLLPASYSLGLIDTLNYTLSLLFAISYLIFRLLLYLISLPFAFLHALLTGQPVVLPPPIVPRPLPAATSPTAVSGPEFVRSLIFWVVFLGIVGYSLLHYIRERRDLVATLQHIPFVMWVTRAWRWMRNLLRGLNDQVTEVVAAGLRRLRRPVGRGPVGSRPRFVNVRRLSPRDQVLFYYLALMRRGRERGLARRPSQTPHEYAGSLRAALPEARQDVAALTQEFVGARYSGHAVSAEQAGRARVYWERIRRALRGQLNRAGSRDRPGN